jgi:hypothetical protein
MKFLDSNISLAQDAFFASSRLKIDTPPMFKENRKKENKPINMRL